MSMPYSTAGATLRRANIAAGLPYATTNPRATNKSSAIACLCYARVESGDLGAKRGDDFGRRGFKPNVRTRVFCASALPVVVTLASPTGNKIINDRMGHRGGAACNLGSNGLLGILVLGGFGFWIVNAGGPHLDVGRFTIGQGVVQARPASEGLRMPSGK